MPNSMEPKLQNEFTGAGSVYQVMKQYEKGSLNASGEKPVFVKPEPTQKKVKSIN
ncbi:hypothetical protein ceV_173 [Chrysochromulina ericina virus CeV-01B]|jgi:hypothetical protein|uniref:Uncharacterized protein n=1 Tax=Chrysochromulina ericina virus CeV-01B TaxID=3070830 RepID=A0A0N9R079_9VIRU|nr:hypothetical protein ceV_173 [Chrysochromulina ericina virus]ALH23079.1 hypothetical protein ceV_173 [Chrysochromulina ericina virus CeV-01B]|tara:strand:- start:35 stop:199 length:165 start_codon:yes stop_codon:yes gene_type:complete